MGDYSHVRKMAILNLVKQNIMCLLKFSMTKTGPYLNKDRIFFFDKNASQRKILSR